MSFFYFGKGIQQKCIKSPKEFLKYVGSKYRESKKQSINDNQVVVTKLKKPMVYISKTQFEDKDRSVQLLWK